MENYVLLAVIVIVFWLAGFAVYLFVSNKQRDLGHEISDINAILDKNEDHSDADGAA